MVQVTVNVGDGYMKELKIRLRKLGLSHRQLAFEMEVDPATFSRWSTGKVSPRMSTVERIEAAIVRLQKKQARLRQ